MSDYGTYLLFQQLLASNYILVLFLLVLGLFFIIKKIKITLLILINIIIMVHLIKLTLIIEYASSICGFFLLTLCISKNYMLPYAHCTVGYFVVVKEWKYLSFFF